MSWFCVSGQELEYGHLSLEALMEGVLSQYSGDVLVLHGTGSQQKAQTWEYKELFPM